MDAKTVIEFFGSGHKTASGKAEATARALGATRQGVVLWLKTGRIPDVRQAQIELASYGKFRCERRPWEDRQ